MRRRISWLLLFSVLFLFIFVQFRLLNTNCKQNEFIGQWGQSEEENRTNNVEDLYVQHIFFLNSLHLLCTSYNFQLFHLTGYRTVIMTIIKIHIQILYLRGFFSLLFFISIYDIYFLFDFNDSIKSALKWIHLILVQLFNRHKCVQYKVLIMIRCSMLNYVIHLIQWVASSHNTNYEFNWWIEQKSDKFYFILVSVLCLVLCFPLCSFWTLWLNDYYSDGFLWIIIIKSLDLLIQLILWFVDRS